MFSFIKKYTESLSGVDIYGDIGLLLFMIVFVGAVVLSLRARKEYIAELARIPFDDSTNA
jgi:cbb3-type cytochrome oxidase subunit 3